MVMERRRVILIKVISVSSVHRQQRFVSYLCWQYILTDPKGQSDTFRSSSAIISTTKYERPSAAIYPQLTDPKAQPDKFSLISALSRRGKTRKVMFIRDH
ncbi:unnamed protein product [Meganyctiphanes norvegica]|uniref:Uncharacterized protein n=1 Tax=Meganyctiphanes norvegica TaxID=48144 RepID=A0AAV2QD03_MEGNR